MVTVSLTVINVNCLLLNTLSGELSIGSVESSLENKLWSTFFTPKYLIFSF